MRNSICPSRTGQRSGCVRQWLVLAIASLTMPIAWAQSAPPAQAQAPAPMAKPQRAPLSAQDKAFIQQAARGGMMQVQLSKFAVERSRNPKVKRFALKSVVAFSKAGGMLSAMAHGMGMQLPQQPPAMAQKLGSALAADRGTLLDQEYMAQMVPASTVAVNLFKSEANGGQNPKLRKFASRMLPKLEQHQKMAVRLSQNMGVRQASRKPSPASGIRR